MADKRTLSIYQDIYLFPINLGMSSLRSPLQLYDNLSSLPMECLITYNDIGLEVFISQMKTVCEIPRISDVIMMSQTNFRSVSISQTNFIKSFDIFTGFHFETDNSRIFNSLDSLWNGSNIYGF